MTVSAVVREIEKDLVFWEESGGGVTFSGGEPLAQPEFLDALLDACLERGIHTVVDTCGMARKEVLLHLSDKVGMFLYDLKLLDPAKHRLCTGASNDTILENLELLAERGRPVTIRLPIIPGINDSDEDVREMADFLSRLGLWRINLLPYHHTGMEKYNRLGLPYRLEGLEPPPANHVQRIALCFERKGFTVRTGG
jgi:pyruvate formate lyase activating enzyme